MFAQPTNPAWTTAMPGTQHVLRSLRLTDLADLHRISDKAPACRALSDLVANQAREADATSAELRRLLVRAHIYTARLAEGGRLTPSADGTAFGALGQQIDHATARLDRQLLHLDRLMDALVRTAHTR